jgi:acetolactate synthase-1/2/3 large subunit
MKKVRGSQAIVQALLAEGVRWTFGIPGTHNTELYDALDLSSIEPVLVTSEHAAAFLADGLARSTGEVGVLALVPGAGVTHALSGIAEAWMDQVPLVVLATGIRSDTGASFQLHAIDQLAVLEPVTKAAWRATRAEDIYPTIRRAFQLARRSPRGPVAVEIPAELMLLVQNLGEAERPALYLGVGAAGAGPALVELAQRLGAPVTTTIHGKGVFPESHPLWLWNGFGPQAPPFVRRIMDRSDCLLAVGCRFAEVATGSYGVTPPENLIHVDVDPSVFDRNYRAALAIRSDAGRFFNGLLDLIGGRRPWNELAEEIAAGQDDVRRRWTKSQSRDRVTPARLFDGLSRHARPGAVFTTDSGNGTFLAMEHLRLDGPGRFLGPIDFSCMGYAVPAAVGAALAAPEKDVVALAGDGALLMTGLELITASSRGIAPLVLVLRDGELGQIAQFQRIPLNRKTCTVLASYRVEDYARLVGARYLSIAVDADVDGVLEAALGLTRGGQAAVVEVAIDYSHLTYFTKGVVKTNFWRFPGRDRLRMLGRALARRL